MRISGAQKRPERRVLAFSGLKRSRKKNDHDGTHVSGIRPRSLCIITIIPIRCKESPLRPGPEVQRTLGPGPIPSGLGLSGVSGNPPCRHTEIVLLVRFGVRILAKSTVEVLLRPLFGQFL